MKPAELSDETRAALSRVTVAPGPVSLRRFPDFMIIGPQRTGTTWLFRNLRQHPRVLIPIEKETYYFSTLGKPEHHRYRFDTLQQYLALFRESPKRLIKRHYDSLRRAFTIFKPDAIGEATATYATIRSEVIGEIALLNPDLKAVLMLRDPIDRAWSHFKKDARNSGGETTLAAAEPYFDRKGQRRLADFPGMIKNWATHLKPGNLFLARFEDLDRAPKLYTAVCEFLGIPGSPRYFYKKHLHEKINPTAGSGIPEPVREFLEAHFAAERTAYRELLEELESSRDGSAAIAAGHPVGVVPLDR